MGDRPVINVGALSPPATEEQVNKEKATPVGGEVEKFLDDALEKHGPNSVVYVSLSLVIQAAFTDAYTVRCRSPLARCGGQLSQRRSGLYWRSSSNSASLSYVFSFTHVPCITLTLCRS